MRRFWNIPFPMLGKLTLAFGRDSATLERKQKGKTMRALILGTVGALAISAAALADLNVGDAAPELVLSGFQAGESVDFTLSDALSDGPVVAFFFPAAYTSGCEAEAALFAESIDEFNALGAQVIGLTAGNVDRLAEFSTQHCADAYPVFGVDDEIINAYEARMRPGGEWTGRITYVIDQDAEIAYHYASGNPSQHASNAIVALEEMASAE